MRTIKQNEKQITMEDSLLLYLNKRMGKDEESFSSEDLLAGPVITISREVGCAGLKIARKLADKLNQSGGKKKWKVFSKEIFEDTAHELQMDHQKIKNIFKTEGRGTFDEILGALGDKRFKSERRIKKAVTDAIRTIAIDGQCIIVGRGAHLITRDIKNALHIRFSAPLAWRTKMIAKGHNITELEALKFIDKTEKERESVRKNINPENKQDENFDLDINISVFNGRKVIELLNKAMIIKGLTKQQVTTSSPVSPIR